MAGKMSRGDIHLCRFAPPDKDRPVLILTRESALGYLSTATVDAVTISQQRLGRRVTRLTDERMREVCAALRFSLGCG